MARRAIPTDASGIPDKPYFKIGEAARLCAVKPYVLRYWETEFKSVAPAEDALAAAPLPASATSSCCCKIRHLLYDKRFTIEGARARLRELGHDEGPAPLPPPSESDVSRETLRKIKQGLADLIRICAD